ncbi:hypothetical protein ATK86_6380 [Nocardia fluminea]|uniref:Uncharacterized protein n=1 Tax=Nocardia fluminea TaxID=134984 RepID=A0A2N3VJW9_9NOCA|nr:hypothetical protein ATK86_6380 [Nocardia fluminea]
MRRTVQLAVIGAVTAAVLSAGVGHAVAETGSLDSGSASPEIAKRNLQWLLGMTGSWTNPCVPMEPCFTSSQ